MKGIRVSEFGEPSFMKYVDDLPMPTVDEPDQVVINVKAVGVNPVETYIRAGAFPGLPDLPYTPGYDCAGIVEAVGTDVTVVKPGDRVWTYESLSGTYAEFVKVKEYQVAPLPDELTFEDGAGLGIPYMTAYRALVVKAGVKKGDKVLVHGASGGAGSASVQMAKALGCTVIGTAGTPEGLELVTKAGADKAFNHRDPNCIKEMLEYASSVDVIVEMAAHANLGKDLPILSKGGRVVVIGSKGSVEVDPIQLVLKESSISGVLIFDSSAEEYRTAGNFIHEGGVKGWVRPIVGKSFPLAEASKAHTDIGQGSGALGRIIMTVE